VGEHTAEDLKIRIGHETEPSVVVPGRDAASGHARLATVPLAEIVKVIEPITESIVETLAACLDDLPPEASRDVLADGMLLIGGASLTRGFAQRLERAFGFPVKPAENPLTCVAEGAASCLRNPSVTAAYGWN
jgi:rod shape-determining protein MreB